MLRERGATSTCDEGPAAKQTRVQNNTTSDGPDVGGLDVCNKHKLPLVIFCDHPDCQVVVCHTCVLLKHKDHRILEVSEKAAEIRKEMDKIDNEVHKIMENNRTHIEGLGDIKKQIIGSAKEALTKIEKEKNELITSIEMEAKVKSAKIKTFCEDEVKKVNQTFQDITSMNEKLQQAKELIAKIKHQDNIKETCEQRATVHQLFKDGLSSGEDRMKNYKTVEFHVSAPDILPKNSMLGTVYVKENDVNWGDSN